MEDKGGVVELSTAGAASPPKFLRTRMTDTDYIGEYAVLAKTLGGAPEITYAADLRIMSRPAAGAISVHKLYEVQTTWALSISVSPQGERLDEEYRGPNGYATHAVPLSKKFPVGQWVHVEMYAQIGLASARSWVKFDGVTVATKLLVANPGVSQQVRAVAGHNRLESGAVGAVIDVDNVDVLVE